MARLRSPGYPNFPLSDVVEFARKIHEQDRQHPVAREVAAKHMGFSGISGTSDRALSALLHYGLAEKVAKGELRVTDLALHILHPDSLDERRTALRAAAFRPGLFNELRERYPGPPPSLSSLSSFLSRSNFAPAAIPSAAKAYVETCQFLQREGAYESESSPEADRAESVPTAREEPDTVQSHVTITSPPVHRGSELQLNAPNFDIRAGTVVHVEGLLDLNGLADLERSISALKMLLKPRPPIEAPQDGEEPG